MAIVGSVLLFLLILTILVLVHEWGHYITAKLFGVRVDEFGIGFPPKALSLGKRKGTEYTLNWLPLGGFVKLKGESGENEDDEDSFAHKRLWKRLIILAAGVIMNVVAAIAIFWIGFMVGLPTQLDGIDANANIRDEKLQITQIGKDSPAEIAALEPGDAIVRIDDTQMRTVEDVTGYITENPENEIVFRVLRAQEEIEVPVTVGTITVAGEEKPGIGVGLAHTGIVTYAPHIALVRATEATGVMIVGIVALLYSAITSFSFDGFMGPVGIAQYASVVVKVGYANVLILMTQLSLSLAILNILPIPALDGGRMLFTSISSLMKVTRGKPMKKEVEAVIHAIGFVLLMALVILVTYRDIIRIFS